MASKSSSACRLETPPRDSNIHYLRTKQIKLGHLLSNLEAKPAKR